MKTVRIANVLAKIKTKPLQNMSLWSYHYTNLLCVVTVIQNNIGDSCRDINEYKKGYQLITTWVKDEKEG
jgi:hypothetical protein